MKAPEGLVAALAQLEEQVTSIVIIEDNPNNSRLIRRVFQKHKNYRVFEANNGSDGIDLVRQRRPDLVVLDLTLPEMDGFSILGELKADLRTRDIPVIIISAKSLPSNEWAYLRGRRNPSGKRAASVHWSWLGMLSRCSVMKTQDNRRSSLKRKSHSPH